MCPRGPPTPTQRRSAARPRSSTCRTPATGRGTTAPTWSPAWPSSSLREGSLGVRLTEGEAADRGIRIDAPMPARLRSLQARLLPCGLVDVVRQGALFALAYYGYRLVRGTVDDPVGAAVAFEHSREVIHFEQSLGIFVEPSIQSWVSGSTVVIDVASWLYLNAQFTVTMACLVYIYLRHNASFYFVRNMFAVAMWTANVGFMMFPAAPPRFFPEWGFIDPVANLTHVSHDSV